MFPVNPDGYYSSDNNCHYTDTWEVMEELVDAGLCKGIGISNFNIAQIRDLVANGCKKYKPSVMQGECHLYLQEKDLQEFCEGHGIVFQCYSPLGSGIDNPAMCPISAPEWRILNHPVVNKIAIELAQTPAQVALRFLLQCGKTLVSKSITQHRISENIEVYGFELSREQMEELGKLNCGCRNLLWPAAMVHPNYPFKDCYAGLNVKPAKPELS